MLILEENQRQHADSKRWAQSLIACRRCGYTPYNMQAKRWHQYAGKRDLYWQPHTLRGDSNGLEGCRVGLCPCLSFKHQGQVGHATICCVGIANLVALHPLTQ
jgi:hypothetical protein